MSKELTIKSIRVGMKVFDRWWPWERRGIVIKKTTRSVVVRWLDRSVWRYDRDHCVFLSRV